MSGNIPITGNFGSMSLSTSPPVSSSFDLKLARMSSSPNYGTSPPDQFKSGPGGRTRRLTRTETLKQLKPFDSADIKLCIVPNFEHSLIVVLLENVSQTGVQILKKEGYQVSIMRKVELIERLNFIRLLCLRIN